MTAHPVDAAGPLLDALDAAAIQYMIAGSVAGMLYGEVRFTEDLDVIVALDPRGARRLHAAFDEQRFYVPPLEVLHEEAGRARHGHFNIYDNETGFRADVYLVGSNELEQWALEHRRAVDVGTRRVWVSPPEYLIAHKLTYLRDSGSPKHVRDVRAILAVSGDLLDRRLLADFVARLGVRAQWDEVVGDARGPAR
ncbi:hypothetical protein tb265_22470 [Gemmatimonadetes bacterium T265]|nr:hypothetical protein tb265_22470 [Gemmatimonadetes bacterium T265]